MRSVLPLMLLLVGAGCAEPADGVTLDLRRSREAPADATVVARFADDAITVADLEATWASLPEAQRTLHADAAGRRALVERVIDFELLAREAARQDLHHDPRILAATKRLMVERLLEDVRARAAATVTEADLKAWYEDHLSDYRRPAEVQVSHLFLNHPQGAPSDALQARLDTLLAASEALGLNDAAGFAHLVATHSEDLHSRSIGGDLRFRSHAELSQRFGPAVADAAFALRVPGERSAWVRGARGVHLLRLTARRPALALSLDQPETRERVQRAVERDRERHAEAALIASLKDGAGVEIDAARLTSAPTEETPTPSSAPIHERSNQPPGGPVLRPTEPEG